MKACDHLKRLTAWIPEESSRSRNLKAVTDVWSSQSVWLTVVDGCLGAFSMGPGSYGGWQMWCHLILPPLPRAKAEAAEYKAQAFGNRKSSQNI